MKNIKIVDPISVIFIILIGTLSIVLFNLYLYKNSSNLVFAELIFFTNIVVILLGIFTTTTIQQLSIQAKKKAKLKYLKNQLKQVEELTYHMTTQNHEYNRHLQTIQALLYLDEIDKTKEYVEGLCESTIPFNAFININDPAISALINSKKTVAESLNIKFDVAIKCNLDEIKIDTWDMCSLLGNLIDNAVESAASGSGNKRVAVEIKYDNNKHHIVVINTGPKIIDKDKIFEPGFTSKNNETRGFGLYIVKQIADKYNAHITIITTPKTTFRISLLSEGEKDVAASF